MSDEQVTVMAIDNSVHSLHAFKWYLEHFYRNDHIIALVHVYTLPERATFGASHHDALGGMACQQNDDGVAKALDKHSKLVKQYQTICAEKNVRVREICREKKGSVGETICDIAKENNARCIVVGQVGCSAIKRAFQGCVTDYVMKNAERPVLVVPGPAPILQ